MPLIAYTILRNDSSNILRDLVVVYPLTVEKPQSVQLMMLCVRAHVLLLSITHRPISPIHMPYTIDTIYDTTCHLFCTMEGFGCIGCRSFCFLCTQTHCNMATIWQCQTFRKWVVVVIETNRWRHFVFCTPFYDSLSFALNFFRLQENRVYFNENYFFLKKREFLWIFVYK